MRCTRPLAAFTSALAVLAVLLCAAPAGTRAQAGAQEQTLYVSAVDKSGAPASLRMHGSPDTGDLLTVTVRPDDEPARDAFITNPQFNNRVVLARKLAR